MCLTFLRRGASIHPKASSSSSSSTGGGESDSALDALSFALSRKRPNAEIVTLLRLHQFNKDHKDTFDSLSNLFVPHDVFMSPRRSRQPSAASESDELSDNASIGPVAFGAEKKDLTAEPFEGLHRTWSNASTSSLAKQSTTSEPPINAA